MANRVQKNSGISYAADIRAEGRDVPLTAAEIRSEIEASRPAEKCGECGIAEAAYDGICYQCQCELHAIGAYDMDGAGW